MSYIANELLENAMKFSHAPSQHTVSLDMYLDVDTISLYVTNSLDPHTVEAFQQPIQRLLTEDTDALYIEQITRNADNDPMGSGLGYLTMVNDYPDPGLEICPAGAGRRRVQRHHHGTSGSVKRVMLH